METATPTLPPPPPAAPIRPGLPARRAIALLVVFGALAIGLPRFITHTPYPRMGIIPDWEHPSGHLAVAQVVGPPGLGVLEDGDIVLGIDGQPTDRAALRERVRKEGWPPGPMAMRLQRGGLEVEVVLPPLKLSWWQRVRSYTLQMAAVVLVPIVAFLLVWRRPDLRTAWLFLWFACLQAIAVIWELYRWPQVPISGAARVFLDAYQALKFILPAAFLHFMVSFPRPRWPRSPAWGNPWFLLVVAAYAAAPILLFLAGRLGRKPDDLYVWYETVVVLIGLLALLDRYARPARPGWAPRRSERVIGVLAASMMFAATVFGVFGALVEDPRIAALFTVPAFRVLVTVVSMAWLASPLLMAYLIAGDPAFDPRQIVQKSIPYALLSGVFAAAYLVVVLVAERMFAASTGEQAMAFNIVAALIVAFAFAPLRDRLQGWLDRAFGRDPVTLRMALDDAGHDLLSALHPGEVRSAIALGLERGFRRRIAVEWPENGRPRLADPEDVPAVARPAVENLLTQAGIRLENLALQSERAETSRRESELRESAARAELRALQAQVQPHFLFNALNALAYLIETDAPAASRYSERLADMLRYTVEAGDRPAALLSEEIGYVEDYLGVARERYENPLEFRFEGPRELLATPVPPLLLQPLIENSLKHGCHPDAGALHLRLAAERDDGWVRLRFTDDGVANGGAAKGLGVGLQNLEQRVRRFAGGEARMAAGPTGDRGFQVTIEWPEKEAA
jgi:hypothetical protein